MDRIAVLIPCYNESQTIEKVVRDWKNALPDAAVYVYDNNSTDGSAAIARKAGAIVRHEPEQGKGNVIRRMFREIDARCYIMVDGDDTYPAEAGTEIARAVLEDHADMVVGDRLSSTYFTENRRPFHNFGNALTRFCVNYIFHSDIPDIMTGLRGFSLQFVKTFPVLSGGFEIETAMTMHALDKRMRVQNLVIAYRDRPDGSHSKLNTIPDGLKVMKTIFLLFRNYKPMRFFGSIAAILLILSAAFFLPVLYNYFLTGLVPQMPTLVVCGFAVIASMLCFLSGLVLDTMLHRERQEFEFRLQLVERLYFGKITVHAETEERNETG